MRVLVFDGPHEMHVETRIAPDPGPGEVRIRVERVGICGSDLHGYTGESGRRVPGMVMGHEASGRIDVLGAGVAGLEPGEVVTFNPALACGGECGHSAENQCERLRLIGVTPALQGAFAEMVVVPASRVLPVGDLAVDHAAMVEPMAVAIQVANQTGIAVGHRVLVMGGGMIGQCVAQAARLRGAGEVVVVDPMPARRALAETAGFVSAAPDAAAELGRFDRAVDAVGVSATAAAAIRAVPRGGIVCFVGLGLPEIAIPLFEVVVSERHVVGSFAYTDAVFREALDRVRDRALDVAVLLGATVPLEAAHDAFRDLASGIRTDVKVLVSAAPS